MPPEPYPKRMRKTKAHERIPGNDPQPLREVPFEISRGALGRGDGSFEAQFASPGPYSNMYEAMMISVPGGDTAPNVEEQVARAEAVWELIDGLDEPLGAVARYLAMGENTTAISKRLGVSRPEAAKLVRQLRTELKIRLRYETEEDM